MVKLFHLHTNFKNQPSALSRYSKQQQAFFRSISAFIASAATSSPSQIQAEIRVIFALFDRGTGLYKGWGMFTFLKLIHVSGSTIAVPLTRYFPKSKLSNFPADN